MQVFDWLNIIFFFLLYFAIVVVATYKKVYGNVLKIVMVYLVVWAVLMHLATGIYYFFGFENNLFIFHLLVPASYAILSEFFYEQFESKNIKRCLIFSVYLFTGICILLSLLVQPFNVNNSYAVILQSVLIVFWVLLYLRQIYNSSGIMMVHTSIAFWFSIGLLIHFIGKLFIQGSLNYFIASNPQLGQKLYLADYFFDYVLLIAIIFSTYRMANTTKQKKIQRKDN